MQALPIQDCLIKLLFRPIIKYLLSSIMFISLQKLKIKYTLKTFNNDFEEFNLYPTVFVLYEL